MSFFSELKRRNVFRVALLYGIASWLLLQVTDVGVSLLDLPAWVGKFVFLLLALGFPLALIFSWVYELTPEGLQKESNVDSTQSIVHKTANKLNAAVIVLLLLALTALIANRFLPEYIAPQPETPVVSGAPEASIAVLRFVNMSSDEENEYFSAGLSEELLNLLARIPNLRVAARTSAFSFAESGADVIAIGEALNVAYVLEGSVRKSGDTVRITAQLINASDGYHVWSEIWDRQLDDIFRVQDEISAAVVDSLKISLLGEAPKAHAVQPEAYTLYLRGKSVAQLGSDENLRQAATLLREALDIEPEYADAWAELATIRTNQVGRYFMPRDEGFMQALAANEQALTIEPGHAQAHSGLCWIRMYYEWDFPAARDCVQAALQHSPRDASVLNTAATFYRNVGRLDLAIGEYKKAQETDPLSASIMFNLVLAYLDDDRLDNAAQQLEIARSMYPDVAFVAVLDAAIELRRDNPGEALVYAENIPGALGGWLRAMAYYDLDRPADVDAELQQLESSDARDAAYITAAVYAYRGDADEAFAWLQRARKEGDDNLIEMRGKYFWTKMYDDPRWQPFLASIGISDADLAALGF